MLIWLLLKFTSPLFRANNSPILLLSRNLNSLNRSFPFASLSYMGLYANRISFIFHSTVLQFILLILEIDLHELSQLHKRKQKQAVTLSSQENLCYICDGLSIVYLLRTNEENVYHKISEIYGRRRPLRINKEADAKV